MEKRKLRILLLRFPDNGSKIMEVMTGFPYCHASIGLEEDYTKFYSFVHKGFIVEEIPRYLKPGRKPFPCQLYELDVSEQIYQAVKAHLTQFVERKPSLRYTRLGLVLSLMRIPYKRKHHYFCSHFVAEVLRRSQAVPLHKHSALYLPGDFRKLPGVRMRFQGNLQGMLNLCPAG